MMSAKLALGIELLVTGKPPAAKSESRGSGEVERYWLARVTSMPTSRRAARAPRAPRRRPRHSLQKNNHDFRTERFFLFSSPRTESSLYLKVLFNYISRWFNKFVWCTWLLRIWIILYHTCKLYFAYFVLRCVCHVSTNDGFVRTSNDFK